MIEEGVKYPVLDHGYVMLVEPWGRGLGGRAVPNSPDTLRPLVDYEVGIVEAARMSTDKGFLGWEAKACAKCHGVGMSKRTGICLTCEGKGSLLGDKRLLKHLYTKKHSSPFEAAGMTLEIQAPIMVFREWHRHRTMSYNELSARYTPIPDVNYVPTPERCFLVNDANKQANAVKGSQTLTHESVLTWLAWLEEYYRAGQHGYQMGLDLGIPKELARLPLTVGRYTRMRATANLRNWLLFMTLRSTLKGPDAQWEIRQVADLVGTVIQAVFPRTYELYATN
jgi:thymidylate synthase (FAD)